jgi:hypothetical protein
MKLFALAAACAAFLRAQSPRQLPINPLPPETVIAHSGEGKSITAGEVRNLLESGDPGVINLAKQNPESLLDTIFVMRYLSEQGEKAHILEQTPWKEQYQILRDRFIFSAMLNQMRETYNVPEQAIDDFYAKNQSRYEQAWIKVIAIGFCPTVSSTDTSAAGIAKAAQQAIDAAHCTSKRTEDQALEIANGLVGKIRAGEDFVKMVKQYSEDPDSKATDGDFGLVTRESTFKQEIKAAVFGLGKDEISNPIRSGSFFYIIKIKDKSAQPLSNVREPIIQELKQKHFTDFMADLTARMKPTIDRPDFFVTPTTPKPGGPAQLVPPPNN